MTGTDAGRAPTPPIVEALRTALPGTLMRHLIQAGDQQVIYIDPGRNTEVLDWLRRERHFNLLVDVTAVDYGDGRPLEVVYQLWSIPHREALRVKCELPLSSLSIASVTGIWQAGDWLEREVYDLFGIEFTGHPDLRRILMPENYAEGHPLRKDFPLRGRFSRAEQTRRALSQDIDHYYAPAELEGRGAPQRVPGGDAPATSREG